MCLCTLCVDRFLTGLARSPLLAEWCVRRDLPLPSGLDTGSEEQRAEAVRLWAEILTALSPEKRHPLRHELEAITNLAGPLGNAHLLEAAGPSGGPPAEVTGGVPLALWFLLHQPVLFAEVHRNHVHRDLDIWRAARTTPCPRLLNPRNAAAALAEALNRAFAGTRETDWHVTGHDLPDAVAFVAVDEGARQGSPERPASSDRPDRIAQLQFVYYPEHGTILLQPGLGPEELAARLLACFASAVLDQPLLAGTAFDLDRLRWPFKPAPDFLDMEGVRLKTLHLRYPERDGRRVLALDTLDSDEPGAVETLLRRHVGDDLLPQLSVIHAVLQVRLQADGTPRDHLVRLWRDYCDVGPGPLGDRMLRCVRRWGL